MSIRFSNLILRWDVIFFKLQEQGSEYNYDRALLIGMSVGSLIIFRVSFSRLQVQLFKEGNFKITQHCFFFYLDLFFLSSSFFFKKVTRREVYLFGFGSHAHICNL